MSADYFEDVTNGRDILGGHANASGRRWFTRRRTWPWASGGPQLPKRRRAGKPGSRMIATATGLLFLLGAGLLGVSLAAQYRYLQHERHQHAASLTEALALDLGMLIFSLLALGLARAGRPAKAERLLIIGCAAGSAVMNYAASDVTSARSVLAYVMPPIFLAVVADRVISVVRRHYLGDTEASAWRAAGSAARSSARFGGLVVLYGLRLALAPRSTLAGGRRAVLLATPLPAAERPLAIEPAAEADQPPPPDQQEAGQEQSEPYLWPGPPFATCRLCGTAIGLRANGTWGPMIRGTGASCPHDPFAGEAGNEEAELLYSPPRPGTKTAAFLELLTQEYGPLSGIGLEQVSPIASAIAPRVGLNTGSARNWLRKAILAAQAPEEADR